MATKDVWLGTTISKTSGYMNVAGTNTLLGSFAAASFAAASHADATIRDGSTGSRLVRWTTDHNTSIGGSSGQVFTEETAPYAASGLYASITSGTRLSVTFKETT